MRHLPFLLLAVSTTALAGPAKKAAGDAKAPPPAPVSAKATLEPKSDSTVAGTVTLVQTGADVKVTISLTGASPGEHAVHIHEKGDCSAPDGSSAGSHFNPMQHQHGDVMSEMKHPGDFGNVTVGSEGTGMKEFTTTSITLVAGQQTTVTDLAVIVHAKADDFSQPVGNAGGRQACGILKLEGAAQ